MTPTDIKSLILSTLERTKNDISDRMDSHGRNASGRSVRSLAVHAVGENEGYLEGDFSFRVMERGRRAGKIPHGFVGIIAQWVADKGISISVPVGRKEEDVYFAIARSIREHGTRLHRDAGYDDIISTPIETNVKWLDEQLGALFNLETDRILQDKSENNS